MPHEKARDDGKSEVGGDTENTVAVGEDHNDGVVDACSWLRPSVPHVGYRGALEEADKEENSAGEDRDCHGRIDDVGVELANTDS